MKIVTKEAILPSGTFIKWNIKENDTYIVRYKFEKFSEDFQYHHKITRFKSLFEEYSSDATEMTIEQKNQIKKCMNIWENYANIKFIESSDNANLFISAGNLNQKKNSTENFDSGAGWPINHENQMVVIIDNFFGWPKFIKSNYLYLHELGHAPLGLNHPESGFIHLKEDYDNTYNTIMSGKHFYLYPMTPMPLDIEAVQTLYGPNLNFNKEDNIHKFNSDDQGIYTIYDPSGNDIIDISNFTDDCNVTLNSGYPYISIVNNKLHFIISNNSEIEKIITGKGNDHVEGNNLNNEIDASDGNNTLTGNKGNDIFVFDLNYNGHNQITDFEKSKDKIKIKSLKNNFLKSCKTNYDDNGLKIIFNDQFDILLLGYKDILDNSDFSY